MVLKKISSICILFATVIFCLLITTSGVAKAASENQISIEQVLIEIQKALATAQTRIADLDMPELESVTLSLHTAFTSTAGQGANLYIFSFSQEWEKERSQKVTLTLKPPAPYVPMDTAGSPQLSEQIIEAIVSAAKGVQTAKKSTPPLVLTNLETEFAFVVKMKAEGGLSFEILPVSASIKGSMKKKALHNIKIVFKSP